MACLYKLGVIFVVMPYFLQRRYKARLLRLQPWLWDLLVFFLCALVSLGVNENWVTISLVLPRAPDVELAPHGFLAAEDSSPLPHHGDPSHSPALGSIGSHSKGWGDSPIARPTADAGTAQQLSFPPTSGPS